MLDQLGIVCTHKLVGLVAIEVKVERGHSAETCLLAHFLQNNSNSFKKRLQHDITSFFFFFFFFFVLFIFFSFEYTHYPSIFLTGNSSTSTLTKVMSAKSSSYSASFGAMALQWLTQNGKIGG